MDIPPPTMMDVPPGLNQPSRRTFHNKVTGETVTWLKYGYETGGEYTLARVTCAPDGGPPPHWHGTYTEHFTCISGTLNILKGKELGELKAGEDVVVTPGTIHRFTNNPARNGGKVVEAEVKVIPAKPGLEKGLEVLYGLCNDGLCNAEGVPSNPVHAALFSSAEFSDTHFVGVAGVLINVAAVGLAAYGRFMGTDKELLRRYYYEVKA